MDACREGKRVVGSDGLGGVGGWMGGDRGGDVISDGGGGERGGD
jgi:hypothetical protein